MTTYAYKNGIIAYDSRCSAGDFIIEDDSEKMQIVNGCTFFITGALNDDENFIECYFEKSEPNKYNTNSAFVWDGENLWQAAISDTEGFWKRKLHLNKVYAMGSGWQFALSAMDLGLTAKESVKYAMTRDLKSGGKVKSFKL